MTMTLMVSACAVFSMPAMAIKYYGAAPLESRWSVTVDTPLECQIEHTIPNYGLAVFRSKASKKINLGFELEMRRPMGKTANVALVSMPPIWAPGDQASYIERLKFYKQFNGYIDGQAAWTMLSELEHGRYPTFSFPEWQSRGERVNVALSAVSFQQTYNAFNACVSRLLPFSFEDIAFTVLHYRESGDDLDHDSLARIENIASFIKNSPDVSLVLLATYTDGRGAKVVNQKTSEKRAKLLKEYFIELGLPEDRVKVQAYGERRPIADDSSPVGQHKNRRVVVSLERSTI
ncbi:flagellar protein MotY [Veronia pacifica]|uniref:Flagellar protein MotY n=1 Tax=Veronia pacifica TaxID=1080227 RepID=A0A1C3EJY3_9GAMM|nr:OmpA family protein [Veronia pacifica]ODA33547.1 flagellar protein MotY [Veronia pacifica]